MVQGARHTSRDARFAATSCSSRPHGVRVMRRLLADRPADHVPPQSGLEARVDRLARDVGVVLRRQVDAGDDQWIGRVDFVIEDTSKIIEVLSRRYHSSTLDRLSDHARFTRLNDAGFQVLTLWDSDIWGSGDMVQDRIEAFWRGDVDPSADISAPEWSDEAGPPRLRPRPPGVRAHLWRLSGHVSEAVR